MDPAAQFLKENARGDLVAWEVQREAASRFGTTPHHVEGVILSMGLLPARYAKNREMIGIAQQRRLFDGTVAVVGCGGLGGYVIEELARLGVGTIKAIDPDVFEEHNLNRQVTCTLSSLGRAKVEAARDRVAAINPACEVFSLQTALTTENAPVLLGGADVAVDGLDSIPARLELADACTRLRTPLVHGAIGGWYAVVLTQREGSAGIRRLYGGTKGAKGIEETLGSPSFTPAIAASIEAAEVCKLLTGEGPTLDDRMLFINLLDMTIETFEL
ncbi:MAG TPA: HesA/MoeB/ThiF family protein [Syntrophorhabdaceae bacterium]|nr:HesA/MoeB/ThiF family protein [Syntrophorhabdaceae bacterium]